MALVKVNGFAALEVHLTLPRSGRWHADLAVDAQAADKLSGAVSLDIGDGALVLKGTARRAGAFTEFVTMEVVGGAAGLLKEVAPKAYQAVPLQLPLSEALAEVGETLSPLSDPEVLAVALPKWTRMRGSALDEVVSLLERAPNGAVGRVLPDGSVWVGRDSYPAATITYDLLRDDHNAGQAELGVDLPVLMPGTTLLGRQVEEVTHTVTSDSVRTLVQFASDLSDPSQEPQTSSTSNDLDIIAARHAKPTRYHRLYPARVVLQNADGTLELAPDSDLMPGLSQVPMRTPAPEMSVSVGAGSRCAVQFEDGDPQRPVVAFFESGALLSLSVGSPAADAAALASKVLVAINALTTAFNLHTHVTACAVGPGTASPPLPSAAPANDVSSSLLKLKI